MLNFIMVVLNARLARIRNEETGATAVEYGLMVALIAAAIMAIVAVLGGKVAGVFTDAAGYI